MKDISQAYINKEELSQRRPVELYHIWRKDESEHWYYTSGDIIINFDGVDYVPAAIKRTFPRYDSQLDVTEMDIITSYISEPTAQFISINPIEILWVSVMKLHRDQSPLEADVIFIGQIKQVQFKGIKAISKCVGFEHFLKKTIPQWRYQLTCNHQVFDSKCTIDSDLYKVTAVVAIDSTKTILSATEFEAEVDSFFTGGQIKFGNNYRTIVAHSGVEITLMYGMTDLIDGDSVDAFPGCDGRAETCRDKYDNVVNGLWFPFIPVENPATRVTW